MAVTIAEAVPPCCQTERFWETILGDFWESFSVIFFLKTQFYRQKFEFSMRQQLEKIEEVHSTIADMDSSGVPKWGCSKCPPSMHNKKHILGLYNTKIALCVARHAHFD